MGWRGSPMGEFVFDECRPAKNMLGQENKVNIVMLSGLDVEHVIGAFFF
jgi:isovaleryl-CoA dehydrogenase